MPSPPLTRSGPHEELHRRQIPLELNPTSNARTGVCASVADHPIRRYYDAGLMVTLNSDDPAFFGSTVENEYRLAHTSRLQPARN